MTHSIHTTFEPDTTPVHDRSTPRPIWFAPAAAVLAATTLWIAAAPLAGTDLVVDQGGTTIEVSPASVVLGSAIGGLGALATGWAARRWSARPRLHFVIATGIMCALSLASPATAATSTATALWLCSMHLVVGAVAIPLVATRLPSRSDSGEAQE